MSNSTVISQFDNPFLKYIKVLENKDLGVENEVTLIANYSENDRKPVVFLVNRTKDSININPLYAEYHIKRQVINKDGIWQNISHFKGWCSVIYEPTYMPPNHYAWYKNNRLNVRNGGFATKIRYSMELNGNKYYSNSLDINVSPDIFLDYEIRNYGLNKEHRSFNSVDSPIYEQSFNYRVVKNRFEYGEFESCLKLAYDLSKKYPKYNEVNYLIAESIIKLISNNDFKDSRILLLFEAKRYLNLIPIDSKKYASSRTLLKNIDVLIKEKRALLFLVLDKHCTIENDHYKCFENKIINQLLEINTQEIRQ